MKFSIASLLIVITLAAMLMLSLQQRQKLTVLQAAMDDIRIDVVESQKDYMVARAHVSFADEVVRSPTRDGMPQAEANFKALQQHRQHSDIGRDRDTAGDVRLWSIPTISEDDEQWDRYRISIPANSSVDLVGDVLDPKNERTRKGNVFLPSSFSFPMPPGDSIVDIRTSKRLVDGSIFVPASLPNPIQYLFHVRVLENTRQLPETKAGASDGVLFEWTSKYQHPEAPRANAKRFHDPVSAMRSANTFTVFYAHHMTKGRSAERLQVFLRRDAKPRLSGRRSSEGN